MKRRHYIQDCSALLPTDLPGEIPACRLVLVRLADIDTNEVQVLLSAKEQEQYAGYRFAKRQQEWLGGRLACKTSVALLCNLNGLASIVVSNDEQGQPHVAGRGCESVHVAISHSGEYAVALASVVPCGLDIQEIMPTLERVQEKFIQGNEQQILAGFACTDLEQLGLVWAIKEALRKQVECWPLLGFLETRLETIAATAHYCMVRCVVVERERPLPQQLPVVYATMYEEHALALCFESLF